MDLTTKRCKTASTSTDKGFEMHTARMILSRVRQEEHGTTMAEYGLMVALIAIAAFAGAATFGTKLQALYVHIEDRIAAAIQ
jgi:Flp pilus assembly pilin Flp